MLQFVLSVPPVVIALVLAGFLFSSVVEREKRASLIAAVLLVIFLAFWLWAESEWQGERPIPLVLVSALSLGGALVLLLPIPKKSEHQTLHGTGSSIVRVDERDVIFSRTDLVKDTPEYDEYYRAHPQFKRADDSLRSVSDLGVPGQDMYSPLVSPLTSSASRFLKRNLALVDGPVADSREELDPERVSRLVKLAARRLGAEAVGIAPMEPGFVYSHVGRGPETHGNEIRLSHPWAICFAVQMDYDIVRGAPSPWNTVETHSRYAQVSRIGVILAFWLRAMGYGARAHIPGSNYQVLLPPLAALSGLGEMGRIGVMVSNLFGPRVRLGAVTTELPLVPDAPQRNGIEEFCVSCLKCATNCPAGAIPTGGPVETRGVMKWTISPESCYKYWCKLGNDCGICLRVCPFSKPDTFIHDVIRTSVKASPLGRKLAVVADDLFYGKHPKPASLPPLTEM
jgi:ferredoxin